MSVKQPLAKSNVSAAVARSTRYYWGLFVAEDAQTKELIVKRSTGDISTFFRLGL